MRLHNHRHDHPALKDPSERSADAQFPREAQMAHRKMRDPRFRQDQLSRCFDDKNVGPINRLVDELRRESGLWIPYVAPLYGGTAAEILFVLQNPGPGTDDSASGSGFLCTENDDPTAELFAECLDSAGLDVGRIMAWNAYPWALADGKSPNSTQLEKGVEPITRLLKLLPKLRVVLLMGAVAWNGWGRFAIKHPELAVRYRVLPTLHTGRRGIINGGQLKRAEGIDLV